MTRPYRFVSLLTVLNLLAALAIGCASASKNDAAGACCEKPSAQPVATPAEKQPAPPSEKIKITKLDDLPQHTYAFKGQVADLVKSDQQVAELANKIRADIEGDLAKYEISDASTLQRFYTTLLTIDLLGQNYDAALARIEKIRALESKEAKKLMTGLMAQSMIAARREAGAQAPAEKYKEAFKRNLAARVAKLPWSVVQDEIQQGKGQMEIISEPLLMGAIQAHVQPSVDQTGELNADLAGMVLGMHFTIKERLPLKDAIVAVYQEQIDANKKTKTDIWTARAVTIPAGEPHRPVLVAAWDSGTDPHVFEQQLWTNPDERPGDRDNDGNGYVGDVHGIAYDINAERTTGLLCPLGDAAGRMPQVMKHMKGFMDLQAAVDSPEAKALKQHLASLKPEEIKGFLEDLALAGNYAHGTHVAGLMLDGNPCARLLIARLSYDHRTVPVARTVEWARRDAAKCRDTVAYFKKHGVRVVNMSWGEALKDAESSLEKNGVGKDADERRAIAREVFQLQKEGLYDAIRNAPEILFVCAAGNADNDVEFDQDIPSSFDLPNLLVVGAVDQAGEPTSFTSFGRTVQVCANGFEVESYVPGGERMKMSGTSMASPNVANLAGKLLAINPALTPPQVIDCIKKGAEPKTDGGRSYVLINPKHTVEQLREHLTPAPH